MTIQISELAGNAGRLTLLSQEAGGGQPGMPSGQPSRASDTGTPRATILIVEDEALTALDMTSVLEDCGYDVVGTAATADAAVALALELLPDLVLLDITLKGKADGIEAGYAIQQLGLAFVYITAHADTPTMRRAQALQPRNYLLKPFTPKQLAATVEAALGPPRNS